MTARDVSPDIRSAPGIAELWPAIVGGLASGLLGAVAFATAHALIIVPIWTRMGSGLALGAVAGMAAGWALVELFPSVVTSSLRSAVAAGARFGALLWILVAPVTANDALLRLAGVRPTTEAIEIGVAVVLAAAAGAAFGWHRARRLRGVIAGGAATVALLVAMAGPVPVGNSPRAFGIFVAVLPAAVIAGAVLTTVVRLVGRGPKAGAPKVP